MKRCLLMLMCFPVVAFSQKKLKVSGKIVGLADSTIVSITDVNNAKDTLGQAVAKNGSFSFSTILPEPMLVNFNLSPSLKATYFFDNTSVKLNGKVTDLKNMKVTGSHSQTVFTIFQKKFNPLFEELSRLNQQWQMTRSDSIGTLAQAKRNEIQKEIDVFTRKYRSSPVSAFLLAATVQLAEDVFVTERRYNLLKSSATSNLYGKYLKDMIAETKVTAIGSLATDFTQNDTLGNPVSLSSFRGKYVLIDFWASWCGPCRQENPNVVQNFQKFKDKNFTVLGVSLDRPGQKDKWLQAIHADNLTWTHVSDLQFWNNAVAQQYRIQSIPQNLLIDPNGKIVAKNLRGEGLESKLCEVLGCD